MEEIFEENYIVKQINFINKQMLSQKIHNYFVEITKMIFFITKRIKKQISLLTKLNYDII